MQVNAVFDIGKTNKKFLLFDEQLNVVQEQQTSFDEVEDGDGDSCEDLNRLVEWINRVFDDAAENENFTITALNFSTYGASLAHLDENGEAATPLYNYLKPFPDDLEEQFYEQYGGKERFSLETATPPMGMLNSGLQLYWLKHRKPSRFQNIERTLHFPQYLSYLFTGETGAEYTSIGCHTGMWNFRKNRYHEWLEKEGMMEQILPVQPVTKTVETDRKGKRFKTGMGIHDSSAALVPYLHLLDRPFMVISTGTWSISLNPFNRESLTFDELRRDCLCYMNPYGEPVKAARFFLGNEYAHHRQKIAHRFHRGKAEPEVQVDPKLLSELTANTASGQKLVLETVSNSGPYPAKGHGEWAVESFTSYKEAYHQLMLDLVSIQADSIELAQGSEAVDTLIVTGGFSRNNFFVKLLASRFPGKKVFTANQPNASALGAALAMAGRPAFDKSLSKELLNLERHKPVTGAGIESYSWNSNPSDRLKGSDGL